MKKLISTLLCISVAAQAVCLQANAYTTTPPAEYSHTVEEFVKNDKLYIYGYYVRDTKVWLWADNIVSPECWYGIDENGEVYARDEYDIDAYNDDFLHDDRIEIYTIKNGEKELVNVYTTDCEYERWTTDLKPYTTYKFQLKIRYFIGPYTDKDGNRYGVYKYQWSDPIKIRTCPKKTGFTFTKVARHTARLKWKAVKCEGYKLQQYDYKKKKWSTIRTLPKSKTSAMLTGLKANTKYKYRVMPYGHVADKRYPRTVDIKDQPFLYSSALFAKPSKAVVLRTKK
ncbi:MAG: fibronectin type III domain-containing protein [Ruminococcus sp.]|nr:fibronectin type III domain-containing protein [Ruminococcus sp.]